MLGAAWGLAGDAAGEAQLATGAAGTKLVATAHLDFRIVIPPLLGLTVNAANHAAVTSNGRSVTLQSAGGTVLLSAARRGVLLRDADCGVIAAVRVVCTAATP